MKKLLRSLATLALLAATLGTAQAQFVPGQVLTAQALINQFSLYVPIAGGTLTGPLTTPGLTSNNGAITAAYSSPAVQINDTSGTGSSYHLWQKQGANVWGLDNASATGQLCLGRWVSGVYVDNPWCVSNSTGIISLSDGLQITGAGDFLPNLQLYNSSNDAITGNFTMYKSRAGAAVQNGDQILNMTGQGYSGTAYIGAADISFYAGAAPSGGIIPGIIYINTTGPAGSPGLLGQWWMYDQFAHVANNQQTPPTLTACGTSPSLRTGSTDEMGGITAGSGGVTSCTLNFANSYRAKPFCTITTGSTTLSLSYTWTASAVTLSFAANNFPEIDYHCQDSSAPGN